MILQQIVLTPEEKRQRLAFSERVRDIRDRAPQGAPGPSSEELLREDRQR